MSLPPTAEKSSCKMRLGFILNVNLHATPAGGISVFSHVKCALYQPPQIPSVFSGKMRLAFIVTVNSNDPRPTAPGFRIFFQLKRPSRKPFQIPCVFSSKTSCIQRYCYMTRGRPLPHSFFFSKKTRVAGILPHSSSSISFCFQVQCVLGSQVSVNSHVMLPAPTGCRFFQRKTRLAGIAGKFQSWNKGICWPRSTVSKGDFGPCDSHLTQRVSLFWVKSRCEGMRRTNKADVTLCDSQFLANPPFDTAGCQRWHITECQ